MPVYEFTCDRCGKVSDDIRNLEDRDLPFTCPCGAVAPRNQTYKVSVHFSENDMDNIKNQTRMKKGLFHDQSPKELRQAQELNAEMKRNNIEMMKKQGFTGVNDPRQRRKSLRAARKVTKPKVIRSVG